MRLGRKKGEKSQIRIRLVQMMTSSIAYVETVKNDVMFSGSLSQLVECTCVCSPTLNTYNVITMNVTKVNKTDAIVVCTAQVLVLSLQRVGTGG